MKIRRMPGIRSTLLGPCLTLALLGAFTLDAKAQIPQPLLYFDCEEGAGATLLDGSPNEHNGNIERGVTFVDGAPDGPTPTGGLQVIGALIQVPTVDVPSMLSHRDSNPDGSYTLAAWMKPDAGSIGGDKFFWGQTSQGIHNGLRGSGTLHTAHWGSDFNANTILTADEWIHATWTYDGTTNEAQIYLNGTVDGGPFSQLGPNGSGNLILGGRNGGSENFSGCVDEIAVWDEVLSESAIQDLADGAPPVDASDEDEDGLPDFYENRTAGNLTDLNGAADGPGPGAGTGDFDGDGVSDLDEFNNRTDPTEADSDGDGLSDGVETNTGTFVDADDTGTDPNNDDTDGDGLKDGVETGTGEFVDATNTGTDPNKADTDGDKVSDGFEVESGTDPNDPDDSPGVVTVQPSFLPINQVGGATAGYEPDLDNPGLDYEENHYDGGVIFNNNAQNNYDVHTSGTPAPNNSQSDLVPYLDHGGGGTTISSNNLPFLTAGENFTVRVNGYIDFTAAPSGTYNIHIGADDTNLFVLDTPDGPVSGQHNCCPQDQATSFEVTAPGYYPIDNVFGEQGGGDWTDLGISGPGITGTVALGDVDNGSPPVYSIKFNGDDSDGDGLPDLYELSFDGIDNLDQLTADGDFDEDGLSDVEEFAAGTDPTNEDSDGDGLTDGDEVSTHETDPLEEDSDSDGLTDGEEINTTETDPKEADSDGDGFSDGREVDLGSDPNDPASKPAVPVLTDLGTGTASLIGGDLTDPEDDGDDRRDPLVPGDDLAERGWNFIEALANEKNSFADHEAAFNLFDNKLGPGQDKWCCNAREIVVGFAEAISMTHFTLSSANDVPNRDWQNWTVEGGDSLDGPFDLIYAHEGTDIDGNDGRLWPSRLQVIRFDLPRPTRPYTHFRFAATTNWGDGLWQMGEIEIFGTVGKQSLFFDVVENGDNPDNLDLIWESKGGELYRVRSETDLAAGGEDGPVGWSVYDGNEDIEATPPFNTLTIARPGDPTRFFVVEAYPAPPETIFGDDFESGQGDWETGSDGAAGTAWELGAPTAGPGAANSGDNAWATNLGSDYDLGADVWLRSPPIDLTTAGEATLWFFEFKDIEEGFDSGSIRALNAADNSELAVIKDVVDGADTEWSQVQLAIPAPAVGNIIRIEFRLTSDDIQNFWGWGIDDFQVTVP